MDHVTSLKRILLSLCWILSLPVNSFLLPVNVNVSPQITPRVEKTPDITSGLSKFLRSHNLDFSYQYPNTLIHRSDTEGTMT